MSRILPDAKLATTKSPAILASPVSNNIFPKLNPEPNRRRDGQSIVLISFCFNILIGFDKGNTNKREEKKIEIIPTLNLSLKNIPRGLPLIRKSFAILGENQKKTVKQNNTET